MKVIQLTQGYDAIVDEEDYPRLRQYRWCVSVKRKNGKAYAVSTIQGKQVRMHRLLLNPPASILVDHKNGNSLDNRKNNLRLATSSQNNANSSKKKHNTSGYKGVSFVKGRSKKPWAAYLSVKNRSRFLGRFDTPEEAARAYDKAAFEYYGEFAHQNLRKDEDLRD